MFSPPPVVARWQEGHAFLVEVSFEDPIVPASGEDLHPSLRRRRESQRTVFSAVVDVQREHITAQGMDVRLGSDWRPELGWATPAPTAETAVMGDLRGFPGWHVVLLRGATGNFETSAPAWWGPADRSPGWFAPYETDQAGPADGELTLTLQPG
ncbi:hypothetical protein [Kineococcus terrestris]|uniref:hypothetical protein n=1 Tax=Kineococcus terrestris TaxID=2044856 RepID=UPI0034DB20D0